MGHQVAPWADAWTLVLARRSGCSTCHQLTVEGQMCILQLCICFHTVHCLAPKLKRGFVNNKVQRDLVASSYLPVLGNPGSRTLGQAGRDRENNAGENWN